MSLRGRLRTYGRIRARHGAFAVPIMIAALLFAVATPAVGWGAARTRAVDSPDHVVPFAGMPQNASLNLYDYWISAETAPDANMPTDWESLGINKGHQFRFGTADHNPDKTPAGSGSINAWTQGTKPYPGVVANRLVDGYPVLTAGHRYDNRDKQKVTAEEPLAYLFDSTEFEGKRVYADVDGLVRYENGYYGYDSRKNFASLNRKTGNIDLYRQPAVDATGKYSGTGQFFPFNSASDVFEEKPDGTLVKRNLKSTDPKMNHYFGAELTVNFTQPKSGMVAGDDMQFHFTGDDDVWLFIDGVLVGDLGGIHGASKLDVNFKTGAVTISDINNAWEPQTTTMRAAFESALGEQVAESYLEQGKDTLRSDSYHTMKFFYLERGNTDSNMALTFNLQRVTQSTIQKTDQFGQAIAGAEFELWAADKVGNDYVPKADGMIARAATGVSGLLTFMTPDGSRPLDFEEVHASGCDYFVLKEVKVPEGYRKAPDAWLHYVKSKGDGQDGFLKCENPWNAGVYSRPNQVTYVNESNKVWSIARGEGSAKQFDVTDEVTLLAVIYKRDRDANDWHPVLGRYGGWSVGDAMEDIGELNELYRSSAARPFSFEDDAWSVDLGDLPGNIEDYRFMAAQDNEDVSYSIGYYLVEMPRAELDRQIQSGKNPITGKNTHMLDSSGKRGNFIRESYAKLIVTDQLNALTVQKTDDAGNPVRGAVFSLYRADQMQLGKDGVLEPKPGAVAFSEKTTVDMTENKAVGLDGAAYFTGMPIKDQAYGTDTYYLVEKSAPEGYVVDAEPIKILVDWSGVYADAGAKGDGVSVSVGVGSLIDSMDHYGSNDGIEVTLHDVIAEKAAATEVVGSRQGEHFYYVEGWAPTSGDGDEPDLHLRYDDDEGNFHEYIENENKPESQRHGVEFTADEGVIRAHVRQDPAPCVEQHGIGTWDDWDEWPVTNLFAGETVVHVANQRVSSFEVEKQVRIPDGLLGPQDYKDLSFGFTVGLTKNGLPLSGEFDARVFKRSQDGDDVQVGPDFKLKNGGTFTLKHGETLRVYGLPTGASYTVEERKNDMPPGFAQVDPAGEGGVKGEVDFSRVNHHLFVNAYRPSPAVMPDTILGVHKEFVAKDGSNSPWDLDLKPAPEFEFVLEALTAGAPMPEGSKPDEQGILKARVVIDGSDKANGYTEYFAPVRFSAPGTYEYGVHELTPSPQDRIPGVSYSDAAYRVTVAVSDGRDGSLKAKVTVVQLADDAGNQMTPDVKPIEPSTPQGDSFIVSFENTLERKVAQLGPLASKKLSGRDFVQGPDGTGEFAFRMRPVGEKAAVQPMPATAKGEGAERFVEVRNSGDAIAFGQSTYTHEDVLHAPYYYELFEVVPGDAVNASGTRYDQASPEEQALGGFALDGVTYDAARYVAEVKLKTTGDHDETVVGEIAYYEGAWSGDIDDLKPVSPAESGANRVWFENEYASSGSYGGIQVTKRLLGRDMKDGEFSFVIDGVDEASDKLLADGDKSFSAPASEYGVAVAMGPKLNFAFTQADAGRVYGFRVSEDVPSSNALPGMTYDQSQYLVEYKVIDNMNGSIAVEPTVYLERDAQGIARHEKLDLEAITDPDTGLVSLGFTNAYEARAAYAGVEVSKALFGRSMRKGEFEFRLEPVNDWSAKKMDERGLSPEEAKAERDFSAGKAADGAADVMKKLMGLTFTQGDVYASNAATKQFSYDVWEVVDPTWDDDPMAAGVQRRGVTFDRSRFRVTIAPKDAGKGNLRLVTTVERTADKLTGEVLAQPELIGTWTDSQQGLPRIPFENTYTASGSISTWMPFTKRLEGRDWRQDDVFAFAVEQELYREPSAHGGYVDRRPGESGYIGVKLTSPIQVDSASPEHNGNHLFGPSTKEPYTEPGIYRYKMYEIVPDDAVNDEGVRYDQASDEQKAAGGFSKEGITYSSRTVHFSVTVMDYGTGVLSVVPTIADKPEQDGAHFVNSYGTSEVSCSLDGLFTKTVEGRDWLDTDRFVFELRAESPTDAPMPHGAVEGAVRVEVSAKDAVDGVAQFGFGNIEYPLDSLFDVEPNEDGVRSKLFTYRVSEVTPEGGSANGMTFDRHSATVHVTVTDNGKGTMTASPATVAEASGAAFVNRYAPAPAALSLQATKHLDGAPLEGGDYRFKLVNVSAPEGVELAADQVKANAADGSVVFDPIVYTRPGVWAYQISEVLPEGVDAQHAVKDGVTYDTHTHEARVTVVEDPHRGILTASATYDGRGVQEPPRFDNSYSAAPAGDDIDVAKTVSASDGNAFSMLGGEFSFKLVNTDAPRGVALAAPRVEHNDALGAVRFDDLTFTLPGMYEFSLSEMDVSTPGVSKDGRVYTIRYEIVDDGAGKLAIKDKQVHSSTDGLLGQNASIKFENVYDPQSVAYELSGSKRIDAADPGVERLPIDGEFSFTLRALGATVAGEELPATAVPMPEGSADGVKTVSNVGGGFSFGPAIYDAPGMYRYSVCEEPGSDASIDYDGASYTVEVLVSDVGGKLVARASIERDDAHADELLFVNGYTPFASVPIAIGGQKVLTGRDLVDGEFTFTLSALPSEAGGESIPADAVPMPAGSDGASKTVANAGDAFLFGEISYTRTGLYRYEVREVGGSAAGVKYDELVYAVTVVVEEDKAGHRLEAAVSYSHDGGPVDSIAFENVYDPAPATLRLEARKRLIGRDLKDGEFSFKAHLNGPDGQVELLAANDAAGNIVFPEMSFSASGAYELEVFEISGESADTVYDETTFHATIEVVDGGSGQLELANITWRDGMAPVFENRAVRHDPSGSEPAPGPVGPSNGAGDGGGSEKLPGTGDAAVDFVVLGAAGAVAAIAGVVRRRR